MATFPSNLGALISADEAAYNEDVDTFDERLAVINAPNEMIDGLEQSKVSVEPTVQYQNDGVHEARGVFGGSFTVSQYLCGYGSTGAGAITTRGLSRSLGRWLGVENVALDGGTLTGGTSATQFAVTGATLAAGSVVRLGALLRWSNEGRVIPVWRRPSGQIAVMSSSNAAATRRRWWRASTPSS